MTHDPAHGREHAGSPSVQQRTGWRMRAALAAAAVLATAAVAVSLGWLDWWWDDAVDAVEDSDDLGAALLGAALAVSTALAVPPSLLSFVAGALFGFARGMALSWAGSLVGETAAFLAGRHLLRARIERALRAWPTWGVLSAQLREDGWLLVLLLRISPATPFSLLNFALGSTQLPLWQYLWPSAVGVVPGLALAVWGGAVARDVSDHAKEAAATPRWQRAAWALLCAAAVVATTWGVAVYAKRAIDQRLARGGSELEAGGRAASDEEQSSASVDHAAVWYYSQRQELLGLGPGRHRHVHGSEPQKAELPLSCPAAQPD
ncbi:hypothetical protein Rsub_10305 [Raphidocelis subcapitata]|uniref:VTT domain-containing protein n=1 Tax=Raphidocelis subcapitata TaxID=307507 RepID=A0A2V0PL71_9CHLO|nr:hypothetical protein Rsub_10305 [Raphidocelis subcapitata]|eukprot:GBF98077.1 hypothetical protein Rsub_10305 [Raphidocelis subcapitata]